MRLLLFGLSSVEVQAQCNLCLKANYNVASASSPNPDDNSLTGWASPGYGFGSRLGYMWCLQYCAERGGLEKTKRAAANSWDYVPTNPKDKRFNDRGANSLQMGIQRVKVRSGSDEEAGSRPSDGVVL